MHMRFYIVEILLNSVIKLNNGWKRGIECLILTIQGRYDIWYSKENGINKHHIIIPIESLSIVKERRRILGQFIWHNWFTQLKWNPVEDDLQ